MIESFRNLYLEMMSDVFEKHSQAAVARFPARSDFYE